MVITYLCSSLSPFIRMSLTCARNCCRLTLLRNPRPPPRLKVLCNGDTFDNSSKFQPAPAMLSCCPVLHHFLGAGELWQPSALATFRCLHHNVSMASTRNSQAGTSATGVTGENSYQTLAEPYTHTLEVKKSKFIAIATSVDNEPDALSFLNQVRDTSASHNCWAFKIGDRTRFSDDGEPGGTAGRPMFSAISSSGLDHVMVVVIRFFGGTKLGTGGLVRAYGKVTTECLKNAPTITIKAKASIKLRVPYDILGVLYPILQNHGVDKLEESFDTEGEGGVIMDVQVDIGNLQQLERELEVSCKGRVVVSHVCIPAEPVCLRPFMRSNHVLEILSIDLLEPLISGRAPTQQIPKQWRGNFRTSFYVSDIKTSLVRGSEL